MESDLAPGQFVTFAAVQLYRFTNRQIRQPDYTFWLYSAGKNRRMPIGRGPFDCEILITAHNTNPITTRWRLALDGDDLVFQRLDGPASLLDEAQQAHRSLAVPQTDDSFDVDVTVGGYYLMASKPEAASQPTLPGIWVMAYDVVVTNRTNSKLPLEFWIRIGMTEDGSHGLSEACTNAMPAWALSKHLEENFQPFDRLLNIPAHEAMHGFLAARFQHSILKDSAAKDVEELAQARPYWVDVTNKLSGATKSIAVNFIARNADRARGV